MAADRFVRTTPWPPRADRMTRRPVFVVDGEAVIEPRVASAIPSPTRVAGSDRYTTAVEVADEVIARGGSLDGPSRDRTWVRHAVSAAGISAPNGNPILLADRSRTTRPRVRQAP